MEVNNMLSQFQLLGTRVRSLNFNNDFVVYHEEENDQRRIDVSYNINEVSRDEEESQILGTVSLYIEAIIQKENEQMKIDFVIEGGFRTGIEDKEKESSLEPFKKMLSLNGCASLYSIARSIIMSITSQSCAGGTIVIPMINVFKLRDEHDEETK